MPKFKFIFLLLLANKIYCQYGTIQNYSDKFGPCSSYLNEMEYYYNFTDMRKDTLRYPHSHYQKAAEFIQKDNRLIHAKLYDRKGNIVSSGNFENGNGKLIVQMSYGGKTIYTFRDGRLNDTTFFYSDNKLKEYRIYKDNIMIYQVNMRMGKTEANYDEDGFAHGITNYYGFHRRLLFIFPYYYVDTYKGKLYQTNKYDHGNLTEVNIYKKDGTIKQTTKYTLIKKYRKRENKNCL